MDFTAGSECFIQRKCSSTAEYFLKTTEQNSVARRLLPEAAFLHTPLPAPVRRLPLLPVPISLGR